MRHLFFIWLLCLAVSSQVGLGADQTLLVFSADWCGPCKQLAAVIEKDPEVVAGFSVAQFDIDAEPELAKNYGVRSVPTLIVLEPSGKMRRKTGFTGSENLKQWLRQKN